MHIYTIPTSRRIEQAPKQEANMKKKQWKNVDTSTLAGLKQAEKLHANGWVLYSTGLFILKFYRVVKS